MNVSRKISIWAHFQQSLNVLKCAEKPMDVNFSHMAQAERPENVIGRRVKIKIVLKNGKKMITISMNLKVKVLSMTSLDFRKVYNWTFSDACLTFIYHNLQINLLKLRHRGLQLLPPLHSQRPQVIYWTGCTKP